MRRYYNEYTSNSEEIYRTKTLGLKLMREVEES